MVNGKRRSVRGIGDARGMHRLCTEHAYDFGKWGAEAGSEGRGNRRHRYAALWLGTSVKQRFSADSADLLRYRVANNRRKRVGHCNSELVERVRRKSED